MGNSTSEPEAVSRTNLGGMGLDVVTIRGVAAVRKAEENEDVVRLTEAVPNYWDIPWLLSFFNGSRHYDPVGGFHLPFTGQDEAYYPCRAFLEKKFTPGSYDFSLQAKQAADALEHPETQTANNELEVICVRAIMNRFLPEGQVVTDEIINHCRTQLLGPADMFNPLKVHAAKQGVPEVFQYFENAIKEEGLQKVPAVTTVGHGAMAMQFFMVKILRTLAQDPDQKVETMFAQMGNVESVIRMVKKDTTIGGLLSKPAIAGLTIIKLNLPVASRNTLDHAWAFGTGTDKRRCCAEPVILEFVKAVQVELQNQRNK